VEEHERILTRIGFTDIRVQPRAGNREALEDVAPGLGDIVAPALIEAVKP
jgi:hypothetical protein